MAEKKRKKRKHFSKLMQKKLVGSFALVLFVLLGLNLRIVYITAKNGDNYVYKARTYYMAPDIDGVVYVISPQKLNVGEFYNVKITKADDYDLYGEVKE